MKPSGKFQGFATSTPEHDMLQLWVSQQENQKKIAEVFRDEIDFHPVIKTIIHNGYDKHGTKYKNDEWPCKKISENTQVRLECPIYSGHNNFLIGIVDGVLTVENIYHCDFEEWGYIDDIKEGIVKMSNDYRDTFNILYEVKPKLDSISQAIGQISTYSDFLGYYRGQSSRSRMFYGERYSERGYVVESKMKKIEPAMLIITLEESTKFDNMLLQQDIRVLHVKENELIK